MHLLDRGADVTDILEPYRSVDRTPRSKVWIMANMVAGLDGSAATGGRVGALSGGVDAELFKLLRALADVVLVGAETVRREGYGPVRLPEVEQHRRVAAGRAPVPPVAIVSRSLNIDHSSPLLQDQGGVPRTMLVTCEAADAGRRHELEATVDVIVAGGERVDLDVMAQALAERNLRTVLCEGGPTLLGGVVAADLLDELCLTVSPVMGGDPLPVAVTPPGTRLSRFRLAGVAEDDSHLFLRYLRVGTFQEA